MTIELALSFSGNWILIALRSFIPSVVLILYTFVDIPARYHEAFIPIILVVTVYSLLSFSLSIVLEKNKRITKGRAGVASFFIYALTVLILYLYLNAIQGEAVETSYIYGLSFQTSLSAHYIFEMANIAVLLAFVIAIYNMLISSELHKLTKQYISVCNWTFDPKTVQDQVIRNDSLIQRKTRAVLIGDIRGYTSFTENSSDELVLGLLERFYHQVEIYCAKYNGFKPEFIADEFITYFDSIDDAAMCGLEISENVMQLLREFGLSMGIGLEYGNVLEGFVGSNTSKKYTLIGSAINTAARLQEFAKNGEVVTTSETARMSEKVKYKYFSKKKIRGINGEITMMQVISVSEIAKKKHWALRIKEKFVGAN